MNVKEFLKDKVAGWKLSHPENGSPFIGRDFQTTDLTTAIKYANVVADISLSHKIDSATTLHVTHDEIVIILQSTTNEMQDVHYDAAREINKALNEE